MDKMSEVDERKFVQLCTMRTCEKLCLVSSEFSQTRIHITHSLGTEKNQKGDWSFSEASLVIFRRANFISINNSKISESGTLAL
jgi:hypothetical protein